MDRKTLVAALLETANDLDTLKLSEEANTVTRIAASIAEGKRLAEIPGYDRNSELSQAGPLSKWDEEEKPFSPRWGEEEVTGAAFPDQFDQNNYDMSGAAGEAASQANNRQSRMHEIENELDEINNWAAEGALPQHVQTYKRYLEDEMMQLLMQEDEEDGTGYFQDDDHLFQGERVPFDETVGGPEARYFR